MLFKDVFIQLLQIRHVLLLQMIFHHVGQVGNFRLVKCCNYFSVNSKLWLHWMQHIVYCCPQMHTVYKSYSNVRSVSLTYCAWHIIDGALQGAPCSQWFLQSVLVYSKIIECFWNVAFLFQSSSISIVQKVIQKDSTLTVLICIDFTIWRGTGRLPGIADVWGHLVLQYTWGVLCFKSVVVCTVFL